jgi:hypothetical protein
MDRVSQGLTGLLQGIAKAQKPPEEQPCILRKTPANFTLLSSFELYQNEFYLRLKNIYVDICIALI